MKKIAQAIVSMGVVLAFSACSWEVPKSVSVKSQADYSFSLGTFEKELDNSMNMSSMMGNAGEGNDKIQTYDYFPGKQDKNTQHFLLQMEVLTATLVEKENVDSYFTSDDPIDGSTLPTVALPAKTVGLDFNPATMLAEMKEALGEDMAGKISFASVPMYLYCETIEGLTAKATLTMYYGDKSDPINTRPTTETPLLSNAELRNVPKPVYQYDGETVITNLADKACIGNKFIDIKDLINSTDDTVQEDDQLCISYTVSDLGGTITKAAASENGVYIKLYAVIDLPVKFEVLQDVKLDISEMTKGSSGNSSSSSGDNNKSGKEEISKYLDIIDSVNIKYIAYKLPFYATSGMELGIDMVGTGPYEYAKISVVDKNKKITDSDKGVLTLHQTTIQKMKDMSNFTPKIQLKMDKNSVFSVPRDKAVEMNIEMGITTDGTVQVN